MSDTTKGSTQASDFKIGSLKWVIPEGYIPEDIEEKSREMQSHEAACILNANKKEAHLKITIFFSDRDPLGPYHLNLPAQRTCHLRFNDLTDPQEIPLGVDYSSLIESDVPIVVQHTRLDSRQRSKSLMTSLAYPAD